MIHDRNTLVSSHGAWPMVERAFRLPQVADDPWTADVWAEVRLPDGRIVPIPAFFDGGAVWKIRFTPTSRGVHRIVRLIVNQSTLDDPAAFAEVDAAMQFEAKGEPGPGFVRRSPHRIQQFVFDDGAPHYPFGQNCAWLAWDEYDRRFRKMAEAGLNWSRVWMCHWAHQNLDWRVGQSPAPGTLDLEVARAWDGIIAAAERHNIRLQIVLQHHGQYSTFVNANWHENPWNAVNGGWLHEPEDFFTDLQARLITRRKYRYIVARWGYSPAVMAWELFNEVQFTNAYVAPDMLDVWNTWQASGRKVTPELLAKAAAVLARLNSSPETAEAAANVSLAELPRLLQELDYGWIPYATLSASEEIIAVWHDEMALWIRSVDPWRHLVTTSSVPAASPIWAKMDYYQYHTYRPDMIEATRHFDAPVERFDRPIFFGEVGDHSINNPAKHDGRFMRTMLWASLMAGGAGPAQIWDWVITDQIDFYDEFRALSTFIEAAGLGRIDYSPFAHSVQSFDGATSQSVKVLGLSAPDRAVVWMYDPENVHADEKPEIAAAVRLPELHDGKYMVRWFDTAAGQWLMTHTVSSTSSTLALQTPRFRGDVAGVITPCPVDSPRPDDDTCVSINQSGEQP